MNIILWIKFNILSSFIAHPTTFFWTKKDFDSLKRWASYQRHPHSKSLTLWDLIKDRDSVWTMNNAEKTIKRFNHGKD
jgi:hypothetical protein